MRIKKSLTQKVVYNFDRNYFVTQQRKTLKLLFDRRGFSCGYCNSDPCPPNHSINVAKWLEDTTQIITQPLLSEGVELYVHHYLMKNGKVLFIFTKHEGVTFIYGYETPVHIIAHTFKIDPPEPIIPFDLDGDLYDFQSHAFAHRCALAQKLLASIGE